MTFKVGEKAFFEYHCYQGHDSADAIAWYHTQTPVTVLGQPHDDEMGDPMYLIRFESGLEWQVFDDELHESPSQYGTKADVEGGFAPPPFEEVVARRDALRASAPRTKFDDELLSQMDIYITWRLSKNENPEPQQQTSASLSKELDGAVKTSLT